MSKKTKTRKRELEKSHGAGGDIAAVAPGTVKKS